MEDPKALFDTADILLSQDNPSLVELRKLLLDIDDFMESENYQNTEKETIQKLQTLRKEFLMLIKETDSGPDLKNDSLSISTPPSDNSPNQNIDTPQSRNPLAVEHMEQAEQLFYSGRYSDALKNYDKVLQYEPNWERAKQHRDESENFLRSGYIPPIALPSEAASSFGKAQSATRAGRYEDAMIYIEKAKEVLYEHGIHRWQEGLEFEQKLQENIDAEKTYQEGISLFEKGKIDDALERIETASRMTGLPKYIDKAQQLYNLKKSIQSIFESLSGLEIDPKSVAEAKSELDLLLIEYGDNPAILRLKPRLDSSIPRAVAPLKDQTRSLYSQAVRATEIDEALYLANQAKSQMEQILNLGGSDEGGDRLHLEIDKQIAEFERYQDEINQAFAAFENNQRWPSQAAKISQEVRQRFPNDPQVRQLRRSLAPFFASQTLIKIIGIILISLIIIFAGWLAKAQLDLYLVSLTPTVTYTPTYTLTSTLTPTSTSTITPSPSPTITSTYTATPTIGITLRDVWARSGCYEGFTATGRIPSGSELEFLPMERRFDTFNRECVLVEYGADESPIIGWILLLDIGSPPEDNQ